MVAQVHFADWLSPRSSHNNFSFRFKYFSLFLITLTKIIQENIVFSIVAKAIAQLLRSILQRSRDEDSPKIQINIFSVKFEFPPCLIKILPKSL